jgi:hypothetical protein
MGPMVGRCRKGRMRRPVRHPPADGISAPPQSGNIPRYLEAARLGLSGHRGEQARRDDGGDESQVLHLGSPIASIIGYRTATAFRNASVTA